MTPRLPRSTAINVRRFIALFALMAMSPLIGCGGDVGSVEIAGWRYSEIYADRDIESTFRTDESHFEGGFGGCTLLRLWYP